MWNEHVAIWDNLSQIGELSRVIPDLSRQFQISVIFSNNRMRSAFLLLFLLFWFNRLNANLVFQKSD